MARSLQTPSGKMRSTLARHTQRQELTRLPCYVRLARGLFGFTVALMLIAGSTPAASADTLPASLTVRDSRQYVYTMGVLTDVRRDAITLRFEDGQTERFAVNTATTIHTVNGEPQSVADLTVGDMVIVISEQDDTTAVTIVNSEEASFSAGGPFDIGDLE